MPPQGYVVLGGLAWNYAASRLGKPTISRSCARHKALAIAVAMGAAAWWTYHMATYVLPAALDAIDTRPDPSNLPEEIA